MITPELVTYITTESARGVSRADIAKELLAAGWKIEDINEAFNKAGIMSQAEAAPATPITTQPEVKNTPTQQQPITDIQKPETIVQQPVNIEPKKQAEPAVEKSYVEPRKEKTTGGVGKIVLGIFLGIILAAVAVGVAYWRGFVQVSWPMANNVAAITQVNEQEEISTEPESFRDVDEILNAMTIAIGQINSYQATLNHQSQPTDPAGEVFVTTTIQKNTKDPFTAHVSTLVQKSGEQDESIRIGDMAYKRQPDGSWVAMQIMEQFPYFAFDFNLPTELNDMRSSLGLISSTNGVYHVRGMFGVSDEAIIRERLGLLGPDWMEAPEDFTVVIEAYIDTETNLPQLLKIEKDSPTERTVTTWTYDQYNQIAPAVPPVSA